MNDLKKARGRKQVQENYSLDHIDQQLLRQLILHPATSLKELGLLVNLSKSAIHKRISKPEFKRQLAEKGQSARESINRLSSLACEKLRQLMNSDDPKIVLESAKLTLNTFLNLNDHTDSSKDVVYSVRFGPNGQMYREIKEGEEDINKYPNTLELMALDG